MRRCYCPDDCRCHREADPPCGCQQHEYDPEPEEDDAYLWPTGPLGSRTSASFAGKYLGEFKTERRARAAVRLAMTREQFWPNVWTVSDHGNHHLTSVH